MDKIYYNIIDKDTGEKIALYWEEEHSEPYRAWDEESNSYEYVTGYSNHYIKFKDGEVFRDSSFDNSLNRVAKKLGTKNIERKLNSFRSFSGGSFKYPLSFLVLFLVFVFATSIFYQ